MAFVRLIYTSIKGPEAEIYLRVPVHAAYDRTCISGSGELICTSQEFSLPVSLQAGSAMNVLALRAVFSRR